MINNYNKIVLVESVIVTKMINNEYFILSLNEISTCRSAIKSSKNKVKIKKKKKPLHFNFCK